MGGLLSCHMMATSQKFNVGEGYEGHCLHLAKLLGDKLMPAFKHVIPYARINLVTGIENHESTQTCSAGAGSLLLGIQSIIHSLYVFDV